MTTQNPMNDTDTKELLIELMGETLYDRMVVLEDDGDILSLYQEWVVDDRDPEEPDENGNNYEWMFYYCIPNIKG